MCATRRWVTRTLFMLVSFGGLLLGSGVSHSWEVVLEDDFVDIDDWIGENMIASGGRVHGTAGVGSPPICWMVKSSAFSAVEVQATFHAKPGTALLNNSGIWLLATPRTGGGDQTVGYEVVLSQVRLNPFLPPLPSIHVLRSDADGSTQLLAWYLVLFSNAFGVDREYCLRRDESGVWHATVDGVALSPAAPSVADSSFVAFTQVGVDSNNTTSEFDDVLVEAIQAATDIEVVVDVKPDSEPNSINLKSKGVFPVAVLTTAGFDALSIDVETVRLGCLDVDGTAAPRRWHPEDVDEDGDVDLLLLIGVQDLVDADGIDSTSTELVLTGVTEDGTDVVGTDSVRIVPGSSKGGRGK